MSPRARRPPIRRKPIRGALLPKPRRVVRRHIRRVWRCTRSIIRGTAVILLIAGVSTPIKVRKNEVVVIEKETGKTIEDLTEDEILTAMKKKGIKKIELTDDDEAEIKKVAEEDESGDNY
jgi:hypothetical protein